MTIPIANIYYLLCYAWRHVEEADIVRLEELAGLNGTHHLLGKILAEGTFRLLRRGIDRGYREVQEDLAGIRGKLAVGETAKRALRSRGRAACEFEELSQDVLHNRILRSTLASLLALPDLDTGVRREVRTAYQKLEGISLVRLNQRSFGQIKLDRNRYLYRFLMSVCRLIHDHLLVDQRSGQARFLDFREDETRMWKLFEDFVIEFYRREQDEFGVNRGGRGIPWDAEGTPEYYRSLLPRMEADVLLDSPERRIILDCKYYKNGALNVHYGTKSLRSDHLYQLLAYLRNCEATTKSEPKLEGILLYPVIDEPLAVDVRLEGFPIRARGINLAQDWPRIHTDMLAVIAAV